MHLMKIVRTNRSVLRPGVWVGLLGWSINGALLWLQSRLFGRMGNI